MPCKIAVCDDCAADSQYLSALTADWAKASGRPVVIKKFPSAEAFLFCYETEKDFDILLLDIEMGECNGVDLAKKIRQDNKAIQIIFVTGFPDFMAEGYEVSALHYLMKPVSADKLNSVLDRAFLVVLLRDGSAYAFLIFKASTGAVDAAQFVLLRRRDFTKLPFAAI